MPNKYRTALCKLDEIEFRYELYVAHNKNGAHAFLRFYRGDMRLRVHGRETTLHEALESIGTQVLLWAVQKTQSHGDESQWEDAA